LYLFVTRDWIGYQGLAIAHSANVLVLFSVQVLSAAYTGSIYGFYDGRWRLAEIFSGWKMILSLALPSMALMMCEWGAYEVNVLLSARFLTKHHFAAVAICQQLDNSLLACPLAVGTSLTIKVGNYVGAGDQDRAKRVAVAGVAMTAALALTGGAVLSLLRSVLPGLFTSDDVVKAVVEDTLPFVSIFFVADCMLGAWTCILRGLGLQLRAAAAAIVSWWLVGMPLGILLYHLLGASLGAKAFFIGPAAGLLLGNALCVYFVMTAEWIPLNAGDGKEPVEGES
jgi:MATE family multidrug resistance protein